MTLSNVTSQSKLERALATAACGYPQLAVNRNLVWFSQHSSCEVYQVEIGYNELAAAGEEYNLVVIKSRRVNGKLKLVDLVASVPLLDTHASDPARCAVLAIVYILAYQS